MLRAWPRSLASKRSAVTPPALVRGDEPNDPAKNRSMRRLWMFLDSAAPALKAVNATNVPTKTTCRPYSSLNGALLPVSARPIMRCQSRNGPQQRTQCETEHEKAKGKRCNLFAHVELSHDVSETCAVSAKHLHISCQKTLTSRIHRRTEGYHECLDGHYDD